MHGVCRRGEEGERGVTDFLPLELRAFVQKKKKGWESGLFPRKKNRKREIGD